MKKESNCSVYIGSDKVMDKLKKKKINVGERAGYKPVLSGGIASLGDFAEIIAAKEKAKRTVRGVEKEMRARDIKTLEEFFGKVIIPNIRAKSLKDRTELEKAISIIDYELNKKIVSAEEIILSFDKLKVCEKIEENTFVVTIKNKKDEYNVACKSNLERMCRELKGKLRRAKVALGTKVEVTFMKEGESYSQDRVNNLDVELDVMSIRRDGPDYIEEDMKDNTRGIKFFTYEDKEGKSISSLEVEELKDGYFFTLEHNILFKERVKYITKRVEFKNISGEWW